MDGARRRGLALGGFMGVGKSTIGRQLAARLGLDFLDMDELLTARHGPIPDQFAQGGEAAFRDRERALVGELCDGRVAVLATGGGVWVDPANRDALRRHYRLVVLTAPLEVLRARVGQGAGRPLWSDAATRLAARAEAYADAELVVDTSLGSSEEVVAQLVEWWGASQ